MPLVSLLAVSSWSLEPKLWLESLYLCLYCVYKFLQFASLMQQMFNEDIFLICLCFDVRHMGNNSRVFVGVKDFNIFMMNYMTHCEF